MASGATMPAAVTVATVAEPVARRISTATIQPSSSVDRPAAQRDLGDRHARAAVDQRLLEAAARADDEHDADDRHQARCRSSSPAPRGEKPTAVPKVTIASSTADQQREDRIADEVERGPQRGRLVHPDVGAGLDQHQHERQQRA